MTQRRYISLRTRLAAALCHMLRPVADGTGFERIIPHDDAKRMTEDQILSLFHFDHWPVPKALGGPDEPWNLEPRPIMEHRKKTAKLDVPAIAKTKRVCATHEEFKRKVLAKPCGHKREKSPRWPKRSFRRP